MRKVKFTQDSFEEKLSAILEEFPMLDVSVCPKSSLKRLRGSIGLASISLVALECSV